MGELHENGLLSGTESLLLESTERLFELNTMTQGVLAKLTLFIGN